MVKAFQGFGQLCKAQGGFCPQIASKQFGAARFGKAEGKMRSRDSQRDNQKGKVRER